MAYNEVAQRVKALMENGNIRGGRRSFYVNSEVADELNQYGIKSHVTTFTPDPSFNYQLTYTDLREKVGGIGVLNRLTEKCQDFPQRTPG